MNEFVRNDKLIIRRFYKYLLAGIVIVFAMQFGSLAHSIVIGNILGEEALTATSLCLPVIYFVELPGLALSAGAPILISTLLGKLQVDNAKKVFSFSLILGILISLIYIPVGLIFGEQIAAVLCGNFTNLIPLMTPYIHGYCVAVPVLTTGLLVSSVLGADSNPNLSALYFLIANITHIGSETIFCLQHLDYVSLFGASLSLSIGLLVGMVVLIPYRFSKKRTLSLTFKNLEPRTYLKDLIKNSSAAALNVVLLFAMTLVMNVISTRYIHSDVDIVIFAMLSNSVFIVDLVVTGVLQLLPSVVGVLRGEKDYYSIRAICKRILVLSTGFSLLLILLTVTFPQFYFYLFGVPLDGVDQESLMVIRVYAISFLFYSFNKFILSYYPTIDVVSVTYVNLILRNVIIGMPVLILFIINMGVIGFAIGTILAETLSAILSIGYLFILYQRKKCEGKPILLLPENQSDEYIEVSLHNHPKEVSKMLDEARNKMVNEHSISKITAAYISITIEEIMTNMTRFSNKSHHHCSWVDVLIKISGDKIILRIRDDNVNFDPTYRNENDEYGLEGLSIIKKIASDVTYLRLLNLNNTIVVYNKGA